MKTFIAVDLGGTNIRAAIVQEDGKILDVQKSKTEAHLGKDHVMKTMEDLIASLKGYEEAEGIGLGIPGPTDTVNGKIIISNNLPDLIGYPIADHIRNRFNKPTFMANDVKVAGLVTMQECEDQKIDEDLLDIYDLLTDIVLDNEDNIDFLNKLFGLIQ